MTNVVKIHPVIAVATIVSGMMTAVSGTMTAVAGIIDLVVRVSRIGEAVT